MSDDEPIRLPSVIASTSTPAVSLVMQPSSRAFSSRAFFGLLNGAGDEGEHHVSVMRWSRWVELAHLIIAKDIHTRAMKEALEDE